MNLLQPRRKTKVLAIILAIIGVIIFISSMISTIQIGEYYIGEIYDSAFTYIIGILFGRVGWGIHLGITLVLISLYLLKQPKMVISSEEEINRNDEIIIKEKQNDLSVLEWFGTLILIAIPLVNLILLLIWAFGTESSKKNFSRATLLYVVVAAIISIIVVLASSQMYLY